MTWRNRSRAHMHAAALLGHVGHDELGGVGRGGGADVGDEVEQWLVGLVADRGHHGRTHRGAPPRISASSEKGSRSSTEPPPRATTMTSTSSLRSSRSSASITSLGAPLRPAWRRRPPRTAPTGQRRRAFSRTSRSAALLGAVTSPTRRGRNGQVALELGREQPLGGEQLAASLQPGEQLAEADHLDLAGIERERAAVGVEARPGVHHDAGPLDQRRVERVEERAGAGQGHRDVGDGVAQGHEDGVDPGRRLTCAIWPSTHTPPSLSIHWETALATARTGAGASAVASRREGTRRV